MSQSTVKWKKILLAGGAAISLSILVPSAVVALYAMLLAIQSQGAPDPIKLREFAAVVGGWGSQVVVVLSTFTAARWVSRRVDTDRLLHGFLLGLVSTVGSLVIAAIFGSLALRNLVIIALELGAGSLGMTVGAGRVCRILKGNLHIQPNPAPMQEYREPSVSVRELYKSYSGVRAVDGVSFEVPSGQVFGLLGPNGAGKTTTVEIVAGLRHPDEGQARVCGFDPITQAQEVKQRIGVAMQATPLPDRIRVREALTLFAAFYQWRTGIDELLTTVSLEEKAESQFRALSGGQQQRLAIALALVNDPSVIILDEPTAGLDPQARREVHRLIERLRDQGRTVILTTHYIEEAERLCDQVAVIDHGKIIALDSPRRIVAASNRYSRIEFSTASPIMPGSLRQIPFTEAVTDRNGSYALRTTDAPRAVVELIAWLDSGQHELLDLHITRPTLEDVFIELTGRRIRE
jgi:ABC-2 type transport system ATP-binding protein